MKYIIVEKYENDPYPFIIYISINGIGYRSMGEYLSLFAARQSLLKLFTFHIDNILSSDKSKFIEWGEI